MQAREMTFRSFFSGNVQFVSPSFQRPYGWESDAWEPVLASALGASTVEHFLGAMVTMAIGETSQGVRKYLLIDGQHRLLTVVMLIAAIRAVALRKHKVLAEEIAHQSLFNIDGDGAASHKFITVRKDRAAFERVLDFPTDVRSGHKLCQAYRFFREALMDMPPAQLKAAYHRIAYQFVVVAIILDKDEDPYPIYKSFSAPDQPFTQTGLDAYTRFSPDPEVMALIAGGESQEVEFKESVVQRDDTRGETRGSITIARSVAGFMNSAEGGTVLLGVRDDGSLRGIQEDYALVDRGKGNWDGFQLFLQNVLRTRLSIENPFLFYNIERRALQGRDICILRVRPASAPVYLDKHLYVRSGNQTIEMQGPDLVHYVAHRWPEELTAARTHGANQTGG